VRELRTPAPPRGDTPPAVQRQPPQPAEFAELRVRAGVEPPPALVYLRHGTSSEKSPTRPCRGAGPSGPG
jgi:hypothetical protein